MSYNVMCQYCNREAVLVGGDVIYRNRSDLSNLFFYQCKPCNAYVGTHEKTGKPFGSLANLRIRSARKAAHKVFDGYWKQHNIRRKDAYDRLASEMLLIREECHIGMFNEDQCLRLDSVVNGWL